MIPRRGLLALAALAAVPTRAAASTTDGVVAPRPLLFPRDHGAHPEARIEWWYATGWLHDAAAGGGAPAFGFQLTFFRSRTGLAAASTSRFAARQLLFAHAALTDLAGRRLLHAERIARWSGDVDAPRAAAALADTRVQIGDWRLQREAAAGGSTYRAALGDATAGFAWRLALATTQPLLLQGQAGYSRKGPDEPLKETQGRSQVSLTPSGGLMQSGRSGGAQYPHGRPKGTEIPSGGASAASLGPTHPASHYYSQPQLAVSGELRHGGRARAVAGRAWLDHEWSESLLPEGAVGWDWIGINLADGGALTAFALRRADGTAVWAGGSHRAAGGEPRAFAADAVQWEPLAHWVSPATRARYPVRWRVHTPVGRFDVAALLDAQELDNRVSTGTVYWEGLAELRDVGGARLGLGYLEMTGYAAPLRL